MYLSISFYGPDSKCGISRYAGMLMSASGAYTNSTAMYSTEPHSKSWEKVRDDEEAKSNHIVLKNWSWAEVFKALALLDARNTSAHFHYPSSKPCLVYLFAPLIFRIMGFNIYQTWHEELSKAGWIKALILRSATAKIFVVKEDFRERSARSSRWVLRLFNITCVGSAPLQLLQRDENTNKNEVVESLNIKRFSTIFLVFGFVFAKRNIELILENIDPTCELLIIAGDCNVDPEYYENLKHLVALRDLGHCVTFLGFVNNETLSALINVATSIIFTNQGGVYNWNTSFLLSCYSSRPVIYLYDKMKGKPKLPGFTGTEVDFGLPECCSGSLRSIMNEVKNKPPRQLKQLNMDDIWAKVYEDHNFQCDRFN